MKQFQGFALFLLLTFMVFTIFQGAQAETDICAFQCKDDKPGRMCGDLNGEKITYQNSCVLDCKGKTL